jgi:hypothetical protein
MLLIYPPVARPCEAPAGIASLAGFLRRHGQDCHTVDMNLEGLRHLIEQPLASPGSDNFPDDLWTRRSFRGRSEAWSRLSSWETYSRVDHYGEAIRSLNRVLEVRGRETETRVSLTNYENANLFPIRSADLIRAAENPRENPFYSFFSRRLADLIEARHPAIAGISVNYLSQALCAFAMIGYLRRFFPAIRVVLGGGLITSWLSRPDWQNPFRGWADDLVSGPGEEYLARLFHINADSCTGALPDYQDFSLNSYPAPGFILPYSASRGCYWRQCAFCPEKAEKSLYRPTAPETVAKDLDRLIAETHPVLIHFLDNAMAPALLRFLITQPPGVPWYGFVRFTQEFHDPDFCMALRKSGCVMLKLGLESGDQAVLDGLGKNIRLDGASRSLRNLHQAGIGTYVYLLFGTPAEDQDAAEKTRDFVIRHAPWIDFLNAAIFNLPLFSEETEELRTFPFYEGDLSLYSQFHHPRGWNRDKVRRFLSNRFRRHPVIASILRRDPPAFTSSHAPLFMLRAARENGIDKK